MERLIALATRAQGGDRAAVEDLLAESAGLVHAVARARLGETLAAEGATLDALARAAQGLGKLKDAQAYPHWLYRIAVRCAANARWLPPSVWRVEPVRTEPADSAFGPVEMLVVAERTQEVRRAIARLPAKLREPLFLHYIEELTYREIARVLDVGLGTVSRRVERALSSLKRRLGEDE